MELRTGTSGFSYKAWKGSFYPEELPASGMLAHYAGRLRAVEINNTFYRLPRASMLEGWAAQVPEAFRFAIKASRRITHQKRLKGAGDETRYLLESCGALGGRLGALLFQLPPNLRADAERLDRFLELLPEGARAAFEFRHPSWADEAIFARLRARDFAWVSVDADGSDAPEPVATASWGYLRLRREDYDREALARWERQLRAPGWGDALVFFKHESQGPTWAAELQAVAARAAARRGPRAAAAARRKAAG